MEKFFKITQKKLKGEWVLLGGSVLPAMGAHHRDTVDIDFMPIGDLSIQDQLRLFEVSEEIGLPIEAINSAASIFLHRIKNFKSELVPLAQSKQLTIYRPSLKLLIQLKMNRLSDSDLQDCIKMASLISKEKKYKNELAPAKNFLSEIQAEIQKSQLLERTERLKSLAQMLSRLL